jgi:hypothetical protein
MSRTVRFAAALLVVASLTCGSLGALPLGSRIMPAESARGDFLTAFVEWIASLLAPDQPSGEATKPPTKDGSTLDPHG